MQTSTSEAGPRAPEARCKAPGRTFLVKNGARRVRPRPDRALVAIAPRAAADPARDARRLGPSGDDRLRQKADAFGYMTA